MTNPGVRVVEDRLHLPSKALKRFAIEVASNQGLEFRVAQGCIGMGRASATVWTCDLTKGYIEINGDYRS